MARNCSYCRHTECPKCKRERKKGYCCQCHRDNVMNGGVGSSGSRRLFRRRKK